MASLTKMSYSRSEDKDDKEQNNPNGSMLSIEERGGECSNPALHEEPKEDTCKVALYRICVCNKKGDVQKIEFRLYVIYGKKTEIETQINKINQCKGDIAVSFRNIGQDNDNFIFPIQTCGKAITLAVIIDNTLCYLVLNEDEVSMQKIQDNSRICLRGTDQEEMRLHKTALPANFSFSLLCKETCQQRTPTSFKAILRNVDESKKEIHKTEKDYAICFYNNEDDDTQRLAGKKILEDNYEAIKNQIQEVDSVIELAFKHKLIDKNVLETVASSLDKEGELLRHLLRASCENVLSQFISVLQESGSNEELVDLLCQLTTSTENQNSGL